MVEHWFITGDTHRDFSRFKRYPENMTDYENVAIIILGDAGINYTLDKQDNELKDYLTKNYKFRIYCIRGNHEARPQDVSDMQLVYDEDVDGEVYMQKAWPQIRYFKDWGIYTINGFKVAVIGGAYSVDKWYRLTRGAKWFTNEQLSAKEMIDCMKDLSHKEVDFIFTHTCPTGWEPKDLFLSAIDQENVDNSMELFFDGLFQDIKWKIACFGHYHADRLERPYVEQYYKDTEDIKAIWEKWQNYSQNKELDWWLIKSPNFYQDSYLHSQLESV